MSDSPPPVMVQSTLHKAIDLGAGVVSSLPAVFLMLLFINAIFLGATMWFLERQMDRRTQLLDTILVACLKRMTP